MYKKGTVRTSVGKSLFELAWVSALLLTFLSIVLLVTGILVMIKWFYDCPSDPKISNKSSNMIEGIMELFADDSSDCVNINKSHTAIDVTESKLGSDSSSDCVKVIETEVMRTRKRRSSHQKNHSVLDHT